MSPGYLRGFVLNGQWVQIMAAASERQRFFSKSDGVVAAGTIGVQRHEALASIGRMPRKASARKAECLDEALARKALASAPGQSKDTTRKNVSCRGAAWVIVRVMVPTCFNSTNDAKQSGSKKDSDWRRCKWHITSSEGWAGPFAECLGRCWQEKQRRNTATGLLQKDEQVLLQNALEGIGKKSMDRTLRQGFASF